MFNLLIPSIAATLLVSPGSVVALHGASCTAEHEPASIVRSVSLERPALAQIEHLTGTSIVRIDLSDRGRVLSASVARSSGRSILDDAAVEAAKRQTYKPETQACLPTAGSYAVEFDFAD
jgi:TonB family protein